MSEFYLQDLDQLRSFSGTVHAYFEDMTDGFRTLLTNTRDFSDNFKGPAFDRIVEGLDDLSPQVASFLRTGQEQLCPYLTETIHRLEPLMGG